VAETMARSVSALDGAVAPGRHGRRAGDPGVIATEVRDVGLALVTARRGQRGALAETVRSTFGLELPDAPRRVAGRDMAFIWSGPEQWLAHMQPAPAAGMEAVLAPLAGLAALVDQSHGRTVLRVTGPRVRDALAKGLPIDLHPRAFQTGFTAVTSAAHIGAQLWQIDDAPTYEIAVARGFALSFWHWLEASAAEYGIELVR
jgi:heterotetrameric sarcosine oxidase gamma subunit